MTAQANEIRVYVISIKGEIHEGLRGIVAFKFVDDLKHYANSARLYDYEIKSDLQLTDEQWQRVENLYEFTFVNGKKQIIISRKYCSFCGFSRGLSGECNCTGIEVRKDEVWQVYDVR